MRCRLMTMISVGIGCAFAQVPQFVDSSLPIQQYVGAALLFYFGALTTGLCIRLGASKPERCKLRRDGDQVPPPPTCT